MSASVNHNDWLLEQLKDAEFAAEYLNAASEDDDPKTYLTALRQVVEARGGMASVAEKANLSRETLYRTLSSRGNPTIKTLNAVWHSPESVDNFKRISLPIASSSSVKSFHRKPPHRQQF